MSSIAVSVNSTLFGFMVVSFDLFQHKTIYPC